MDHHPSWKLHKNPFWRVKHPSLKAVSPADGSSSIATTSAGDETITTSTSIAAMNRNPHQWYAYEASENVQGVVVLTLPSGKKVDHLGIKIQFIGRIDMVRASILLFKLLLHTNKLTNSPILQGSGIHEGRPHYDFVSLSKELSPPGTLYNNTTEIPFLFKNMDKEHDSYRGRNVAVRYGLLRCARLSLNSQTTHSNNSPHPCKILCQSRGGAQVFTSHSTRARCVGPNYWNRTHHERGHQDGGWHRRLFAH